MRKLLPIVGLFISITTFAQSVVLSKMEKVHENKDKHLYKIENTTNAEYLGEVEVGGFSNDDALMFGNIYKKAKELGANAFKLRPIETVDGQLQPFDPNHYFLSLYYVDNSADLETSNQAYIIGAPTSSQKIGINNQKLTIPERSYKKITFTPGEVYTISTLKLLGSTIKLTAAEGQKVNYFQISGFKVKNNTDFGINLKSGDIVRLETSFGMFLTTIYKEIQ